MAQEPARATGRRDPGQEAADQSAARSRPRTEPPHTGLPRTELPRTEPSHAHPHSHAGFGSPRPASHRFRGRLAAAFTLTGALFVAELVVGLIAGSLAVVADAGHMATDVVTLGAALAATRIAARPDATGQRTYGRYRAEVFAAGFAVLLMFGVGIGVVVGAVNRIGSETHVQTGLMAAIGVIGLVVNVVSLLLLRAGAGESLNIRGAYLEVLGDAAGSVGVVVAAGLIAWTSWAAWDVVVAVGIGGFVVARAIALGRAVLRVLGQHAPAGLDPHVVAADLSAIDGVADVHDVHLWELTSGMTVATAHLTVTEIADHHAVLDAARDLLAHTYDIEHATLQVEPADHASCRQLDW